MEIVLWLTVVVIAALLLLLIVTIWRSWRRRVPPVFTPGTVGAGVGGERVTSGRVEKRTDSSRSDSADSEGAGGPVDSPYPPGARPAGPGAEGMAVSSPGDIVPGWNEDQGDTQEDKDIREDKEGTEVDHTDDVRTVRTSDREHMLSSFAVSSGMARRMTPGVDS